MRKHNVERGLVQKAVNMAQLSSPACQLFKLHRYRQRHNVHLQFSYDSEHLCPYL